MEYSWKREMKAVLFVTFFLLSLMPFNVNAGSVEITDFNSAPPFLPGAKKPNILFILDLSKHMVTPAYGACYDYEDNTDNDCVSTLVYPFDDYNSSRKYSGLFEPTKKYTCTSGNSGNCQIDPSGIWDGAWLNWLTMLQFDLAKKAVVGGDFRPAVEGTSPLGTIQTSTEVPIKIYKTVSNSTCSGKAPTCSSDVPQEIPYDWIDTPAGNTPLASGNLPGWIDKVALPFDFTMGQTFSAGSNLYINVNGWLSLRGSDTAVSKATNYDMPTTNLYDYSIAPLWINQELVSNATVKSAIHYFVKGTAPNRVAVITFQDVIDEAFDGGATSPTCVAPEALCNDKVSCGLTEATGCTSNGQCCGGTCDLGFVPPTCSAPEGLCIDQNSCGLSEGNSCAVDSDCCGTCVAFVPTCGTDQVVCVDTVRCRFPDGYNGCAIDDDCCSGACNSQGKCTGNDAGPVISAGVCAADTGTVPSGKCVTDGGTPPASESADDDPLTYQVLLFEGSNQIIFQYKEVQTAKSWGSGVNATIAVQGDASAGQVKKLSHKTAKLRNSMAVMMTPNAVLYEVLTNEGGSGKTVFRPAEYTDGTVPDKLPVEIKPKEEDPYRTNYEDDCTNPDYPYKVLVGKDKVQHLGSKFRCLDHNSNGLLHEFREEEQLGNLGFRLSIMKLAGGSAENGGIIDGNDGLYFNGRMSSNKYNSIRNESDVTSAPLAEALYEAMHYFDQEDTIWTGDYVNAEGDDSDGSECFASAISTDPYCFDLYETNSAGVTSGVEGGKKEPCCRSFVMVVSSGVYSNDFAMNTYSGVTNTESPSVTLSRCKSTTGHGAGCVPSNEGKVANGGFLDDVAYYAHVTDLRPDDSDLPRKQNLTIYTVNTFGGSTSSDGYVREGRNALVRAARYGGFEDGSVPNSTKDKYDPGEDDMKKPDGIPDTYFEVSGDSDLKETILAAVEQILKSAASGTSVSVLSTSAGGQGAIYQAYFFPSKVETQTQDRSYPGFMRSFFIDKYQNLRDDASGHTYTSYSTLTGNRHSYTGTRDGKLVMGDINTSDKGDYVTTMFVGDDSQIRGRLVEDADGLDVPLTSDLNPLLEDVVSVFESGQELAKMDKNDRNLYVWLDADKNGIVGATETIEFIDTNKATLQPYLRAAATLRNNTTIKTAEEEAEDIIDFIRGEYVTGYRNRCITVAGATKETNTGTRRSDCEMTNQRVWPLGDIIYSTPTLVSGPSERYDQLYGDSAYRTFRKQYADRRNMIYVGANDGMLHAFNGGFFESRETKFCRGNDADSSGKIEGTFNDDTTECGKHTDTAKDFPLGAEMWGLIVHDNLPHLAWLACNATDDDPSVCGYHDYKHVYFVDERPKVSDVRIFDDDAVHPGGWGTILIMGLRFGGGAMNIDFDTSPPTVNPAADAGIDKKGERFRSAYFLLDITDSDSPPKLIGKFSHPNLGFSTSYPAIARVGPIGSEKWFTVIGSGPDNDPGAKSERDYDFKNTAQTGKIFVVEMTKNSFGAPAQQEMFSTSDAGSIMADPSVIDVDLNYDSDVIYIGATISETGGKMYRINTNGSTTVDSNWELSTLFSDTGTPGMGPVTVPASASLDQEGRLLVFFGTGKLRNEGDTEDKSQQRFYAIKDGCWINTSDSKCIAGGTYGLTDLFDATSVIVSPDSGSSTQVDEGSSGACGGGNCSYRDLMTHVRTKSGWFLNLSSSSGSPSERVVARSAILGGLVMFTTYTPVSIGGGSCSSIGSSKLYALYYETGTAYDKPIFEGTDNAGNDINATEIQKSLSLGEGMPTAVGIAVGETVTGFVQKSTGEIVRIKAAPGLGVRSGRSSWREKIKGGGTVEIEETYKHIVK